MPHRGSSPPLISLPLLIILLPILTLTLLFLAVPPLLSAATNILQHTPIKTTWNWNWNSFNIILVFLAILFGVFARRNDDESSPQPSPTVPHHNHAFRRVSVSSDRVETSGGYESQQWFGFSNDETPNRLPSPVTGVNRLRRSSSSYPDLRQMETDDSRYKFRFFDDFEIEKQFRSPSRATFSTPHHRRQLPEYRSQSEEQVQVKEIPVDTFQIRPSPVKSSSPPPPPPPPPASRRRNSQSIHQRAESRSEITELEDAEFARIDSPPPTPTPPRPSVKTRSEQKHGKNERRKSNVKREIAMVWASVLSNQRKRKKKERPRNDHNHHYENVDELRNNTTAPPIIPPPPPPLPPPSVFHSIFRKGMGKSKKIHSVPAPPPPPPSRRPAKSKNQIPQPPLTPPPPRRFSKPQNQIPQPPPTPPRHGNRMKPPLPNKSTNFINDTLNIGNQSPLIPIPPPLPPFKIPAIKFELRGDFVKILSNQSSRCTSPEREHIDGDVSETNSVTSHKSDGNGHVFCPSPDVNAKAATFIARLRGEWRLQKLNSIKEKGNGSLPLASDLIH